jgi:integrase
MRHTVAFLAEEFIERRIKGRHKQPEYTISLIRANILPTLAERDARSITSREIVELIDEIVDRGAPVLANRVAALLTQMFRFGVGRALLAASPVVFLERPGGRERPRERTLKDSELQAFLRDPMAATRYKRLAHVITLLLLTGQRRGELAAARCADVDLDAGIWRIPPENSKNGRGHEVPLSAWAIREFKALMSLAASSPWVLPDKQGTAHIDAKLLTRGLAKNLSRFKALGVAEFTLHDLRRTCRTGLAKLGVPPHIAERVLNHAQERIPGTYDRHDYLDEKREALDKWADYLAELVK